MILANGKSIRHLDKCGLLVVRYQSSLSQSIRNSDDINRIILVNGKDYPIHMENKKCLKPPTRYTWGK